MGEYLNSPAMSSIGHSGSVGSLHSSHMGCSRNSNSGDPHAKRNRGADGMPASSAQCSHHDDALMELARENLLLKRQLHVASLEVGPAPRSQSIHPSFSPSSSPPPPLSFYHVLPLPRSLNPHPPRFPAGGEIYGGAESPQPPQHISEIF